MRAATIDDKLNIKDLTHVMTRTGNYWKFGNIPTVIINGASDKLRQVHILYNLIEHSNTAKFREYMCKNMPHNPFILSLLP